MPAGNRDRHIACQDAGSLNLPLPDLVPELAVVILQTAHGADGGHAAEQRRVGVFLIDDLHHLPGQTAAGHQLYRLFDVHGLFLWLAASWNVHMQIDQARHQVAAAQILLLIFRWHSALRHNVNNFLSIHQYSQAVLGLHIFSAAEQMHIDKCVFHGNASFSLPLYAPPPLIAIHNFINSSHKKTEHFCSVFSIFAWL